MKKHKISLHAKRRIQERASTNMKPKNLYKSALQKGYNLNDFTGPFREYLEKASSYSYRGVKVHNNLLFIYNKNNKNLITVIDITEKWGDAKQYLK